MFKNVKSLRILIFLCLLRDSHYYFSNEPAQLKITW